MSAEAERLMELGGRANFERVAERALRAAFDAAPIDFRDWLQAQSRG
jgi:hypothetical protein